MSRFQAGLHLGGLVAFWLIAWLPLALYCLLAFAVSPIFPNFPRLSERRAAARS
jgi:hypothetical protein